MIMFSAGKRAVLKWGIVTLTLVLITGCWNSGKQTDSGQQTTNTNTQTQTNTSTQTSTSPPSVPAVSQSIVYKNTEYGFNFTLPESWNGYSIILTQWAGYAGAFTVEKGPIISIRDPKWTSAAPRQDIPIMVFTINQWNSLQQDVFHIGAAPVNPSELGRNSTYVFALPARYNFASLPGVNEVEKILENKPLQTIQATERHPDSTEILLRQMMTTAKQGKVLNCSFAAKTNGIWDIEKFWGKADKMDTVPAAKGNYYTYTNHNIVFGINKGGRIFEVRSNSGQLKGITLVEAKEVLGTPPYDVKVNGQEIIGYKVNSDFKLELVFPQPVNNMPNTVIDHYNVFNPAGTINSMADDSGRQW